MPTPLWTPSADTVANANLTRFAQKVANDHGVSLQDYAHLHQWSIDHREPFWDSVWDFCQVIATHKGDRILIEGDRMPGATWFPDARLNFAENLLRCNDEGTALIFKGEDKVVRDLSHAELTTAVSRLAQALRDHGLQPGDRVAGYLPNMPEAIIAMLAVTSIGAVWSSCSPDFGVRGVVDRFGQIEPKLLFAVDGYYYNGKPHDCTAKIAQILPQLPSIRHLILIPYAGGGDIRGFSTLQWWDDFCSPYTPAEIEFEQLPFDHPLYIMYSSGTTGVPKCIVHGAGGTLLQHLKEHQLHTDIRPGDCLFYFTTCGWMMWNWLATGLASGATLLLYDGSPFYPDGRVLFDFADATGMTVFGTSAKYIDAVRKAGLVPAKTHDLGSVRALLSTGSPLAPESFDFVYSQIKSDICLSSIAGGTDIMGCFMLGNPTGPVYRGEIQCLALGMAVTAFDDQGATVIGEKGELVCTKSFPSMPLGFWHDDGGDRYHAAYFAKYPNTWCHGDFVEITATGGVIIYGRSDSLLNPGGVRIGTAEIYRQVEQLEDIMEGIVVGQEWDNDVRVVLFVKLTPGTVLTDELIGRIKQQIRHNTTPRHVPAKVLAVEDIPRTKSGKIVELAVREVIHGRPVKNKEALANPEALAFFAGRPELTS